MGKGDCGYLTLAEVALLANMDERSVRNAANPKLPDPLMGWAGSGDTQQQVVLKFPTQEAAQAYANRYGIEARVAPTPPRRLKIQAYADNFR